MLRRFLSMLQIDQHIAFSLILRIWSIFAGGLIVLVIPYTLTKVQQGFYFTFSSLLAAQIFFELGLNTVIAQIVGHEMAFLKFNKENHLEGSPEHLSRIHSLFKLIRRFYAVISVLFFLVALAGGYIFFSRQPVDNGREWIYVWPFLTFFTAVILFSSPFLAALEGMGLVSKISKVRLLQSMVGYTFLFLSLFMQFGLKSMIAIPAAAASFTSIWLWVKYKKLFFSEFKGSSAASISWRREIFPFQWRIALSWLSGYFIYQLFNPVIFSNFGAEAAGRVGLALTVFATIGALSFSWVNAKAPVMTNLIATGKTAELNSLFKNLVLRSAALNLLCCSGFIVVIEIIKVFGFFLADRLPDLTILLLLALVCFSNHLIFSVATFMRAHKKEPMLANSVFTAVLSVVGLYAGAKISVFYVILVYAVIILVVSLPWALYLFQKFYKQGPQKD